ncbi:hypothetical protein FLAVO9R_110319 [Flavobacterium sp. 9R]|nr:hypothetical protein FLAVO9R_110319 [Flavobacterium sp. 9R]
MILNYVSFFNDSFYIEYSKGLVSLRLIISVKNTFTNEANLIHITKEIIFIFFY